jgi:hypothetical protein
MRSMARAHRLVAFAALGCALAASVSGQRAAVDAPVPFRVGETLGYDVTWASYLTAGSATTSVTARRPSTGSVAYSIVAEGRPVGLLAKLYTLHFRMETLLDSAALLPHRASLALEDGGGRHQSATRFDRKADRVFFEVLGDAPFKVDFAAPPQVQDGLSALYVLRAMAFRPGARFRLPITDEGFLYNLHADTGPEERVRVPAGEFAAWNVQLAIVDAEGLSEATQARVWISTDARRLPVKLEAALPLGSFVLALRDAQ